MLNKIKKICKWICNNWNRLEKFFKEKPVLKGVVGFIIVSVVFAFIIDCLHKRQEKDDVKRKIENLDFYNFDVACQNLKFFYKSRQGKSLGDKPYTFTGYITVPYAENINYFNGQYVNYESQNYEKRIVVGENIWTMLARNDMARLQQNALANAASIKDINIEKYNELVDRLSSDMEVDDKIIIRNIRLYDGDALKTATDCLVVSSTGELINLEKI